MSGLLQDKRGYAPVEDVMHKEIDYYVNKKDPFRFIRVDRFVAKTEAERFVAALWACEYDTCRVHGDYLGNPLDYNVCAKDAKMVVCHNDREVAEAKLKCPTYHAYYLVRRQDDVYLFETLKDGETYEYALLFDWPSENRLEELLSAYVNDSEDKKEYLGNRTPMFTMGVWMSHWQAFNGIAFSLEFYVSTEGRNTALPEDVASILGCQPNVDWQDYDVIDVDYVPDEEKWEYVRDE